jgi:geranylgeranyl diphosphate synthase, type I
MSNSQKIDFINFSNKYIPKIENFISEFFDHKIKNSSLPFIEDNYKLLKEYCGRDGKRIRPLILLSSYFAYGGDISIEEEVIKLASTVELMHSFLLIQDDIIDKSELRRGGKSLHIVASEKYSRLTYNENIGVDVSIILADIIFANSIEIISHAKIDDKIRNNFLKIFSSTYEMTAWGQILDSLNSKPKNIDIDKNIPIQISKFKTAYYTIYYPMLMGYILAGNDDKREIDKIEDFAMSLGLAFQIRDDILGTYGKVDDIGKPDDSDIIEGKMTLLVQNCIERLDSKERENFLSVLMKSDKRTGEIKYIRDTIRKSSSLDITIERQVFYIKESKDKLLYLDIEISLKKILDGLIEMISDI